MLISYKSLEHEVFGDAPFVGARLSAVECNLNCTECQNQWMKELPTVSNTAEEILEAVEANPFNQGIILGGLEWTVQLDELLELLKVFTNADMQVILYTGHTEDYCYEHWPEIFNFPIWVKFGQYKYNSGPSKVDSTGVKLASTNQYIKFIS